MIMKVCAPTAVRICHHPWNSSRKPQGIPNTRLIAVSSVQKIKSSCQRRYPKTKQPVNVRQWTKYDKKYRDSARLTCTEDDCFLQHFLVFWLLDAEFDQRGFFPRQEAWYRRSYSTFAAKRSPIPACPRLSWTHLGHLFGELALQPLWWRKHTASPTPGGPALPSSSSSRCSQSSTKKRVSVVM